MATKITDAEIDLFVVRDQYVAKKNKLNRLINDYEARVCDAVVNGAETEAEKNRLAVRGLRRLRDETQEDINIVVTDLNRMARERNGNGKA